MKDDFPTQEEIDGVANVINNATEMEAATALILAAKFRRVFRPALLLELQSNINVKFIDGIYKIEIGANAEIRFQINRGLVE